MTHSYPKIWVRPALQWVEAHRGLEVADPDVGITGPQPEPPIPLPTQSETRVEFKGTVHHCDRGGQVLAEVAKHSSDQAKNLGVVSGYCKCATSKIDALASVPAAIVRPASAMEYVVAKCGER